MVNWSQQQGLLPPRPTQTASPLVASETTLAVVLGAAWWDLLEESATRGAAEGPVWGAEA